MEALYFGMGLVTYALSAFISIWAIEEGSENPSFSDQERKLYTSMGIIAALIPIINTVHSIVYLLRKNN